MTTGNETAETIGRTIGRAMARDVIAEDMPRVWTGLDPQDHDRIPEGIDPEAVEAAARAAFREYLAARPAAPVAGLVRCQACGAETETYVGAVRDDGARYEKSDGTIAGPDDLALCVDCLNDWLAEADESEDTTVRCQACGELKPHEEMADRLAHNTGGEVQCLVCHRELMDHPHLRGTCPGCEREED